MGQLPRWHSWPYWHCWHTKSPQFAEFCGCRFEAFRIHIPPSPQKMKGSTGMPNKWTSQDLYLAHFGNMHRFHSKGLWRVATKSGRCCLWQHTRTSSQADWKSSISKSHYRQLQLKPRYNPMTKSTLKTADPTMVPNPTSFWASLHFEACHDVSALSTAVGYSWLQLTAVGCGSNHVKWCQMSRVCHLS